MFSLWTNTEQWESGWQHWQLPNGREQQKMRTQTECSRMFSGGINKWNRGFHQSRSVLVHSGCPDKTPLTLCVEHQFWRLKVPGQGAVPCGSRRERWPCPAAEGCLLTPCSQGLSVRARACRWRDSWCLPSIYNDTCSVRVGPQP